MDTNNSQNLKRLINNDLVDLVMDKPWDDHLDPDLVIGVIKGNPLQSYDFEIKENQEIVIKDWMLSEGLEATGKSEALDLSSLEKAKANSQLILVVDDLKDMRDLISSSLKKYGYTLITAANGLLALEAIKQKKPDLIVCDWMMPAMSGPELIAELKKDPDNQSIPIILLTAKSDEESKFLGTKIGADGFLGKRFKTLFTTGFGGGYFGW